MDSLFVLFIIWAIGKAFGKKKKPSINQMLKSMPAQKDPFEERAKQKPMTGEAIQARKRALQAQYGEKLAEKKQAATASVPVQSTVLQSSLQAEPAATPAGAFGIPPLQPLEGVDPCHDELYEAENTASVSDESGTNPSWEPNFAWNRQSLVQAVVMQEILTRPCQRQRRGYR